MSELHNVLNALRNSRKLQHWNRPPREFGPDNPEDSDYNRNGLKDVGDLSKITFSPGFSFGEESKGCEEAKSEDVCPESTIDITRLEEPVEVHKPLWDSSLDTARKAREQYWLTLMMEKLELEKECRQIVKERSRAWHELYLNKLNKIRADSEREWQEYVNKHDDNLAHEEIRLREQTQEAEEAVIQCQNEYSQHISQCSSVLVAAFERAQQQEAEEANTRRTHLTNLHNLYTNFVSQVTEIRQIYRELEGSESFDTHTESFINHTVTGVEDVISTTHHTTATQDQLLSAQESLQQSFIALKDLTNTLNVKKEEKAKQEQERAAQEAEANRLKVLTEAQQLKVPTSRQSESQESVSQQSTTTTTVPHCDGLERLKEVNEKVKLYVEAKDKLTPDRIVKLRQLSKPANQLNINDQSINRDRLQQLLASFAGREVELGKGSVQNETELMYLKNLVARNAVKLGISHDKPTTGVCSWLIVSLMKSHPDMYDLFLYHLFSDCPGLMMVLPEPPGQRSIDLQHQTLGRRNNEREDQFSGRNGNCAFMYGLVLAMLIRTKESPQLAPVNGWQLMARVLSAPPVPCVTGEIILDFLKAFGSVLQQTYGKQFLKLMVFVCKVYLPMIDEVKGAAGSQCFAMLQTFVKEFERSGKIQPEPLLGKYKLL